MKKLINFLINTVANRSSNSAPIKIEPSFPYYICLEITNACNLRCVQCLYKGGTSEHYQGKVGRIDINLAKNVLKQLKKYNVGVMLNGDGESLVHPGFHEIAEYAMNLELPNVYFNTNGTLFNAKFTDKFITYFKGSVSFSLDGFKESHERIRIGSNYDSVINNIEYLRAKIAESGADIKIGVAYCNYDQPEGEREKFVEYWINKVDVVSIGEVYDKDYKIISNQLNRTDLNNRVMCTVPWETFIVRWDGKIIACSNCFALEQNNDVILGDATTESLYDVWHGPVMARLRKRTESWELQDTFCDSCQRWNMYVQFEPVEKDGMLISRSGIFTTYRKKDRL